MTDRYVIVYKDGSYGPAFHSFLQSNSVLRAGRCELEDEYRPAYRIRIREKQAAVSFVGTFDRADIVGDGVSNALPVPKKRWARGANNIDYVFP